MKKLIAIALLVTGLSVSAQKFENLFNVDTLADGIISLQSKKAAIFVNKDDITDSIEMEPLINYYAEDFKEKGVILHGFWISKCVNDSLTLYFNGKGFRMGECLTSMQENFIWHKIYTGNVGKAKQNFVGITEKVVIGNKTYIAIPLSRGLLSATITGFDKITCEWYE